MERRVDPLLPLTPMLLGYTSGGRVIAIIRNVCPLSFCGPTMGGGAGEAADVWEQIAFHIHWARGTISGGCSEEETQS